MTKLEVCESHSDTRWHQSAPENAPEKTVSVAFIGHSDNLCGRVLVSWWENCLLNSLMGFEHLSHNILQPGRQRKFLRCLVRLSFCKNSHFTNVSLQISLVKEF